jgi:uncharacterized OB-fold protein
MGDDRFSIRERIVDEGPRPDPLIHPDTAPFWEGLEAGELRVQRCGSCRTYRFPFAPVCHVCGSFELTWEPIEPSGTVATAVRVQRATGDAAWGAHVPLISGNVQVAHGLRLPGRILCTCGQALQRGTPVRAVLLSAAGRPTIHAFAHDCAASPANGVERRNAGRGR